MLSGEDGNDTLKGGGGTDVLNGGAGDDTMQIDGGEDHAYGGEGNDTLVVQAQQGLVINLSSGFVDSNPYGRGLGEYLHAPHCKLGWAVQPLWPHPHAQGDTRAGDRCRERGRLELQRQDRRHRRPPTAMSGQQRRRLLSGRGGDDVLSRRQRQRLDLSAALGADTLTGGANADTFIFTSVDDSKFTGGRPQDVITDFQHGQDTIDLSGLDIALNDLLEVDNQTIDGANYSYVGVDANHNGQFDEGEFAIAVKMAPGSTLHASDFVFSGLITRPERAAARRCQIAGVPAVDRRRLRV